MMIKVGGDDNGDNDDGKVGISANSHDNEDENCDSYGKMMKLFWRWYNG